MFINYFKNRTRRSPLNIIIARIILGVYVIWKTVWYDWELFLQTPVSLGGGAYTKLIPYNYPFLLTFEKWALILVMISFILGYRLLISSYVGALLLAHLAAIRFTLNLGGGTTSLFIGVWFIIFFGLFHEQNWWGVDMLRNKLNSLSAVNQFLKSETNQVKADSLGWCLLSISLVYFGAGFLKAVHGPLLEWGTVENLSRTIIMMNAKHNVVAGIGPHLVEYPSIMFMAAWGTIFLELGFVLAVLIGVSITPIVLGVYFMQLIIGLSMGPFFFDIYILLSMFFAWDSVVKSVTSEAELDVVYDEHCYFCARSLLPFKILDVSNTISFYSQYDAPEEYRDRESVQFDPEMYVFEDGEPYAGYFAFRRLLDQFGIFSPLVRLMRVTPIEIVGQKCYKYIAENRSRYFACDVNNEMEDNL